MNVNKLSQSFAMQGNHVFYIELRLFSNRFDKMFIAHEKRGIVSFGMNTV